MYRGRRNISNGIVLFVLALIINMSVNVHDSLLMDTQTQQHNEVESLIELLMLSINTSWELPDSPDGIGEDQVASSLASFKCTCYDKPDLLAYFPPCQILNFPDFIGNYIGITNGPIPPPPIIKA